MIQETRGQTWMGKALSAGVRSLPQIAVIFGLAAILGVKVLWNPLTLLGLTATAVLGAALFATFSLIIACLVKTRERFMGVGQLLTMPLFFASNAIYPTAMMPRSLQIVAHLNPLTYEVDALRLLLLPGFAGTAHLGLGVDLVVLSSTLAALVTVSARLYPHIAR